MYIKRFIDARVDTNVIISASLEERSMEVENFFNSLSEEEIRGMSGPPVSS